MWPTQCLTDTVVTKAAVRGTRLSEDLTGEAVLELDRLPIDDHLSRPGGRPVTRTGTVGYVCQGDEVGIISLKSHGYSIWQTIRCNPSLIHCHAKLCF